MLCCERHITTPSLSPVKVPSQGLEFEEILFYTLPTRGLDQYGTLMTDSNMLKIPAGYASDNKKKADRTTVKYSSSNTSMNGTSPFLFQSYLMAHPGHDC